MQIAILYATLAHVAPSPVVELNRAVALAMVDGPAAGLAHVEPLASVLDEYPYLHATRADLLRRLARWGESAAAYARAIELTTNGPERTYLARRLAEVRTAASTTDAHA
jgi:RNA polymerase sigma-70 factor (ECF subfamily)